MSEPIRLNELARQVGGAQDPAERRLLIFMRALALVWFAKAMFHWAEIIGLGAGGPAHFMSLPLIAKGALGYLAIIDTIAVVGLWFGATWGGLLWLLAGVTLIAFRLGLSDLTDIPPWVAGPLVLGLAAV